MASGGGGAMTKGTLSSEGIGSSLIAAGIGAGSFRLDRPYLILTPAQSVSTWASSRTDDPGTWRIDPSIALRKPCIQAIEKVTSSVSW